MIKFWFKESLRSMKRAKASFALSVITFTISVLLVFLSFFLNSFTNFVNGQISDNLKLNVFVKDSLSSNDIMTLGKTLSNYPFVKELEFIDKNEAEKIFVSETGEDFKKILEYNPLPASYSVVLTDDYLTKDSIVKIITVLSTIPSVEEIVYQRELIDNIVNTLSKIKQYTLIITGILLFISIAIIFSTLKLVISSRYDEFETIKLIGAKLSAVKMPVILNGLFIGVIADIVAVTLLYIAFFQIPEFSNLIIMILDKNMPILLLMLLFAPFIGFCVSVITLKKVSLKI